MKKKKFFFFNIFQFSNYKYLHSLSWAKNHLIQNELFGEMIVGEMMS